MRTITLLFLIAALFACTDVVLGDRIDDQKIAQIEVRNPGLLSYDVWLVLRDEKLNLVAENVLFSGLDERAQALTLVRSIKWHETTLVVTIVNNDQVSAQNFVMTDGTKTEVRVQP